MTLSIITINYNNRNGLQKTIDSVLSQTWTDYEWIIIDGGSTDGSKELIERYQEHFSYWCSEPDKGVYNAMNKGIAKAKGEFLNFMNSGDRYYNQYVLEKIFGVENSEDVIYGDWIEKYNDREVIRNIPNDSFFPTFLYQNICHQAMFFKSTILKEKGYDESMKVLADWYINTELILEGINFKYVPITICLYDMNGMSNQKNNTTIREECSRIQSLYPKRIIQALQQLNYYNGNRYIQYTERLINGNCIVALITKAFLLILKNFTKRSETKNE